MTSSEVTSLQMADERKCITGTGIYILYMNTLVLFIILITIVVYEFIY